MKNKKKESCDNGMHGYHAMMATIIGQTLHTIIIKHPIIRFGSYNIHILIH